MYVQMSYMNATVFQALSCVAFAKKSRIIVQILDLNADMSQNNYYLLSIVCCQRGNVSTLISSAVSKYFIKQILNFSAPQPEDIPMVPFQETTNGES